MKSKYLLLAPLLALTGCTLGQTPDIVVTSFVSYDAVKNISGDEFIIKNIVPWGSELHDFEPSPRDIKNIHDAKLFVYTSLELDTWVKDLVEIETSFELEAHYISHEHAEEHSEDEHDHEEDHGDIHFFTNPVYYLEIFDALLPVITELNPAKSDLFTQNHDEYTTEINTQIDRLTTLLSDISEPTIYFAGHNALSDFAEEFGLHIVSLSDSYKPDVDFLSPNVVAFIEALRTNDIHYLFVEELVEPRMAELIKIELAKQNHALEILELHGYHNITAKQAKEQITYAELFEQNVTNLSRAFSH
ncbi:MAG: metal ABC transporter substrate-binding protein [Bacilli bacterium]